MSLVCSAKFTPEENKTTVEAEKPSLLLNFTCTGQISSVHEDFEPPETNRRDETLDKNSEETWEFKC